MTHLLDTDHISILQTESGPEYEALLGNLARHDPRDVVLSIVSFHEQVNGATTYLARARTPADLPRGYARLERVRAHFRTRTVLLFDTAASDRLQALLAARVRIGAMDLRIAATALSRGLTVVTRNARDFTRVPGLALEDWTR